jgi:hypothetical protein
MSHTRTWTRTSEREAGRARSLARRIEERTAQLPPEALVWGALGATLGSLLLHAFGKREQSLFVGQWVPALLILGIYQKLARGAEAQDEESEENLYH